MRALAVSLDPLLLLREISGAADPVAADARDGKAGGKAARHREHRP